MKGRTLPMALLAAAAAGALSIPFFVQPLRPWPDQGRLLHAAVRHARGLGLTLPAPVGADLTLTRAERLTYFPPLYPLAVSACLRASGAVTPRSDGAGAALHADRARAGRAVDRVVKAVNALALLAGALGWCRLAAGVLGSRALGALFAALLATSGGALVPKGGTADYLLWAVMPGWLGAILAADAAADAGRWRRALAGALAVGLLGGLLVGVRWAAVFLVPSAGLFWLVRAVQWTARETAADATVDTHDGRLARLRAPEGRRALAARLGLAAAAGLPVAAAYVAITTINSRLAGGAGSVLTFVPPRWDWHRLATLFPFECVFAVPLGIEPLLTRAWRALEPVRGSPALGLLFRLLLPGAALGALVAATRRSSRSRPSSAPAPHAAVAARAVTLGLATLGALLAFLALMSLRYTWSFVDWSYLDEARYYRPVWPLAALVWLALLDRLPAGSRFRTAAVALLLLGVLYVFQAQTRFVAVRLTARDESWELVERVRALERGPGLHVVLDNDVSDYVVAAGPRLLARLYPDPEQAPRLTASRPAELWLVRRLREPTAYVLDRDWDRKRFEAVRARFGARRAWVSTGGAYEVWHATAGP